ncbi:FecR domain-containing protein [Ottowia sp.]|uniref:FecR domain-containing protein n=1 Tax=Ottowia sp. TaxID=1898956 RepID=UPI002CBC1C8B|nr:FecR domain-containing protein [Ottowia sp.]HOB65979.1 FecR domain-containing protein [Ottowia sp.]HPZ58161.1 FecR domain-containing protein [Ottowia sp.]HQD46772.1 FecR domain-containing protein [Ottowia sp.]
MPALSRIIFCLVFALGLGGAPWALAQTPTASAGSDGREGTFKTVRGEVTVVRGDVRSAAIASGPVYAGDRVVTGLKSAASLVLRDGTVLSVGPDSVVNLSSFGYNSTTQEGHVLVDLLRGSLRMATGLIAKLKPEQVKVTTPTTVVGVRGTDFIVEENP